MKISVHFRVKICVSRCFHFWVFEIFVSSLFLLVVFGFWFLVFGIADIQHITNSKQIIKKILSKKV